MTRPVSRAALRRAARRFVVGLEGPSLAPGEREILAEFAPGGVILFRRNLESRRQVKRLVAELREAAGRPILVALDQEGGKVDRLAAIAPPSPSAEALAARGEVACRRGGNAAGRALAALGFDVDFAPVADLRPDGAESIGFSGRSFGASVDEVVRGAGAFLDGLHDAGVAGCLKHFPGLGRGRVDSHLELPVVAAPRRELLGSDVAPFAWLSHRAPAVMVSHALYTALDKRRPASLSPAVTTRLLRATLGPRVAVFTDDLEMGALARFGGIAERSRLAFLAGATWLLVCRELSEVPEAAVAVARAAATATGRERMRDAEGADRRFRRFLARLRS